MSETRTALVTGGAGSIGRAAVARLLADGMNVAMVDLSEEALREAAASIAAPPGRLLAIAANVTQPDDVTRAVAETVAAFGHIDALAAIAGGAGPTRAFRIETIDDSVWDHVMMLNVTSTFLCCRAVVPLMRARRHGRIVTLSSIIARGEKGPPNTVTARLPYATAKAALIGFTAQLAKDEAEFGITVNTLLPGLILGEQGTRVRQRFEDLPAEERARMMSIYPGGRPGTAEEAAAAVAFLLSDAASFISGTQLPVDGAFLG